MWTQMNADGLRYKSKSKVRFSICVHLCLSAFAFPVFAQAQETITVAVASSLYAEMQKQAKAFEKEQDVHIRLVSGSTGRLYNQIMQGAPFDAFIAADSERPARLAEQGKVFAQYNVGQGYLGVRDDNHQPVALAALRDSSIHHIVIANPDVAPFGRVSKQLLQEQGLWAVLKPKLVYARSAMQAKMMLDRGLVDAGFVPLTSAWKSVARIPYHAVVLVDRHIARQWLDQMVSTREQTLTLGQHD